MNQDMIFEWIEKSKELSEYENRFTLPEWYLDYMDYLNIWIMCNPEYAYKIQRIGDYTCKPDSIITFILVYKSLED